MSRIVSNPKILGGKPIIENTRLSVEFILELLASGATKAEILTDYSYLTEGDLSAVLDYAAHSLRNEIYIPLKKTS
ncbi:MAG: DUF433 domain-containing protein [bacterium]